MKNPVMIAVVFLIVFLGVAMKVAFNMGTQSELWASGEVFIERSLEQAGRDSKVLFITVFDMDKPFPPYGAYRKSLSNAARGKFHEFFLTKETLTVMQPGLDFPKNARIKARLDYDGNAGMDQPGDIVGVVENVKIGQKGLKIVLDQKL